MELASSQSSAAAAARSLRRVMTGTTIMRNDRAYQDRCKLWNGAVARQPALIAVCRTSEDVEATVRAARDHGLPLSVRGGGHDWAGRALRAGGLVIDLSEMRSVSVDAPNRIATCQGGARGIDLIDTTAAQNLIGLTGHCSTVGLAGLYLGGGYSPLSARYGLGVDNLLAADVVLSDGKTVRASNTENPELLWALRGGGGNFGVVTSLSVRLFPANLLLCGMILFPLSDAPAVLRGYATLMARAPEELTVTAGMLCAPDGSPAVFLAPVWSGDLQGGEQIVSELRSFGSPLMDQIGPMRYGDLIRMYDAHVVQGNHYDLSTRWLTDLSPEVIDLVVGAGRHMTSPFSIIVLHHFHGAGARVHPDATSFRQRGTYFTVETIAAWVPSSYEKGNVHRQWAWNLIQALTPFALPGAYSNILGPDEGERARLAYGTNLRRLQDVKRTYDPNGVFTASIPLMD